MENMLTIGFDCDIKGDKKENDECPKCQNQMGIQKN